MDLGRLLGKTPDTERPNTVVFTVITDELVNTSREFVGKQVADMIAHQKSNYDWSFIFLGADIDVARAERVFNSRTQF